VNNLKALYTPWCVLLSNQLQTTNPIIVIWKQTNTRDPSYG
jgi:hypothetical protein